MKHYGAFDAKTHFSEILNLVSQGEKCVITKHGNKVALLIPFLEKKSDTLAEEAVRTIKANAKGVTLGRKLSVKEMRAEGRN